MAGNTLTAIEYELWLSPREALNRVSNVVGDEKSAAAAIIQRLHGGVIIAASKICTWEIEEVNRPSTPFSLVPSEHWGRFDKSSQGASFWRIGDVRFYFGNPLAYRYIPDPENRPRAVTYFGVRIGPAGMDAWLADLPAPRQLHKWTRPKPKPEAVPPEPTPNVEGPEVLRGPRVPDPLLRAWHELYSKAYTGAEDTLANAEASARGMFPGKHVARDRIRELIKGRKRGRKPSDEG